MARSFSDEELNGYLSDHLAYELLMLRYTAYTLDRREQMDWNICIESFCVHARNIYTFLTNKETTNISLINYIDQGLPIKGGDLGNTIRELDAATFHLAASRVSKSNKTVPEDVANLLKWLEKNFDAFVQGLPPKFLPYWNPKSAIPDTAKLTYDEIKQAKGMTGPAGPHTGKPLP